MVKYVENKVWNNNILDLVPKFYSDLVQESVIVFVLTEGLVTNVTTLNEFLGQGKIVALQAGHYWKITCNVNKWKNRKDDSEYYKPTLVVPFISDAVSNSLRKCLRESNINANICFKVEKLYDLTRPQTFKDTVNGDTNNKGVVYLLTCTKCENDNLTRNYIGETRRKLSIRLNEHFALFKNRLKLTEVGKHSVDTHGAINRKEWRVEILAKNVFQDF